VDALTRNAVGGMAAISFFSLNLYRNCVESWHFGRREATSFNWCHMLIIVLDCLLVLFAVCCMHKI